MKRFAWSVLSMLLVCMPLFAAQINGPGLYETPMMLDDATTPSGIVGIYNSRNLELDDKGVLVVDVSFDDGWLVHELHLYLQPYYLPTEDADGALLVDNDIAIPEKKDKADFPKFPHRKEYEQFAKTGTMIIPFNELFENAGFEWGIPSRHKRTMVVVLHADLVKIDDEGEVIEKSDAWGGGDIAVPFTNNGTAFVYQMAHHAMFHFIDSPVEGLGVLSPTYLGKTGVGGEWPGFPGERAEFYAGGYLLGDALVDHKVSPLDIFEEADTDDPRVINMARLLQSLDYDAEPQSGITITADIDKCLNDAMVELGLDGFNFDSEPQIDSIILETISQCEGKVDLAAVAADEAKENLDKALDSVMFRKNVSKTPVLGSSKSKLNIMGMWFPAFKANGELASVEYYDENGALIRTEAEAKPVVVTYTDGIEATGYEDIFAGISRDDGNTFKRMNLSRAADRTSFTLANGDEYFGQAKKPVFGINGNKILVAWSSKFCKGGKPTYAIDPEDDYEYDDPYFEEDIWGVGGPQRSVDYAELGFPEVGEVPYSCVWTARGVIATQKDVDKGLGEYVGDIVWFKPERLTSGRRDANQIFMGTGQGSGFAIAWQEDPEGLRPGGADGPGPGWGGATTNHKTDIWYSFIHIEDFLKVDANFVEGGDPEHDLDVTARPKALVPMSLPVRVTDNDVVNSDNIMATTSDFETWTPFTNPDTDGDGDGTHAYGYVVDGLCVDYFEKVNEMGDTKQVCVTDDNRLLDGDTGASRPNLFLQTYTKPDGTKSAWTIFAYEETKGVGAGAPDNAGEGEVGLTEYVIDEGKNAIYHSFDFQKPELVSAGTIINHPERDADGNLLYLVDENGALILDWQDQPQLAYENARRPRFILQGKSAIGDSGTSLLVLYKEGQEGSGRPSDIMMRRMVAPDKGNPYAPGNFTCDEWQYEGEEDQGVCIAGAVNMSSVTPTVTTDSMGDPEVEDPYGAVKVIEWTQTVDNLDDPSWLNPYDDARAHRGQIRGDFVVMGFSYTPNWAASRNGNDKYDFFVRRSFDGGVTWTTNPAGSGVEHCQLFKSLEGESLVPGTPAEPVCTFYPAGDFEVMRNVSQLGNNKESVIEPRIVAVPGTIKDPATGAWTGIAEDKQDPNVFYVSYGTSTNPKKDPVTGEQDEPHPLDLWYSFSQDKGESYVEVAWDVNPDSSGDYAGETVYRWDYMAKGDPEQGEAQLRMTPNGERFYATWLQEGEEGSDIWFRRIMSPEFPANVATQ